MNHSEEPDPREEQSNNSLNVLLLYQGEFATEPRNEIREFFRKKSKFVNIKTVSDGDASIENTPFKEFLTLVEQCHVAIALLTPDDRFASEAGNLWFEIGYWLATKPANTLLVLAIEGLRRHPATKKDQPPIIKMISDLWGRNYEKVEKDKWLEGVYAFIEKMQHLRSRTSKGPGTDEQVFRWVFGHSPHKGTLEELSICKHLPEPPCPFRRGALILTAELLAMFKVHEKHLLVQDSFRRISYHSGVLFELGESELSDRDGRWERIRIEYAEKLCEDFSELRDLMDILDEVPESWNSFLAYRILHHQKYFHDAKGPSARRLPSRELRGTKNMEISKRIDDFFEWGRKLQTSVTTPCDGYSTFCRYGRRKIEEEGDRVSTEIWGSLRSQNIFSEDISKALAGWALEFYRDWYHDTLASLKSKDSFHAIMQRLVGALPHVDKSTEPFDRQWVQEGISDATGNTSRSRSRF